MERKLKIGVVGLNRGLYLARAMLSGCQKERIELRAICDLREDRRSTAAETLKNEFGIDGFLVFSSYDELLASDIDAVIVATDATIHTPMAVQALNAGKHVLSEIPAINSEEEAQLLRNAVRAHPELKYMFAENCCFWSFINQWKTYYDEGKLGRVWYAEAEYLHNIESLMRDEQGNPTWRASYHAIQYLTHDLGPLLYILGDRCVSVSAFAPSFNPIEGLSTGTPNEVAIFRTESGALIKILVSFSLKREPMIHNFTMYGSEGTLESDRSGETGAGTFAVLKGQGDNRLRRIETSMGYPGYPSAFHGGADVRMTEAFIDCILSDRKPPIDAELGIAMSLPGIYAHRSMELGGIPLEIPRGLSDCESEK